MTPWDHISLTDVGGRHECPNHLLDSTAALLNDPNRPRLTAMAVADAIGENGDVLVRAAFAALAKGADTGADDGSVDAELKLLFALGFAVRHGYADADAVRAVAGVGALCGPLPAHGAARSLLGDAIAKCITEIAPTDDPAGAGAHLVLARRLQGQHNALEDAAEAEGSNTTTAEEARALLEGIFLHAKAAAERVERAWNRAPIEVHQQLRVYEEREQVRAHAEEAAVGDKVDLVDVRGGTPDELRRDAEFLADTFTHGTRLQRVDVARGCEYYALAADLGSASATSMAVECYLRGQPGAGGAFAANATRAIALLERCTAPPRPDAPAGFRRVASHTRRLKPKQRPYSAAPKKQLLKKSKKKSPEECAARCRASKKCFGFVSRPIETYCELWGRRHRRRDGGRGPTREQYGTFVFDKLPELQSAAAIAGDGEITATTGDADAADADAVGDAAVEAAEGAAEEAAAEEEDIEEDGPDDFQVHGSTNGCFVVWAKMYTWGHYFRATGKRDVARTEALLLRASNGGYARFLLGLLYYAGFIVDPSTGNRLFGKARAHFTDAIAYGNDMSNIYLARIELVEGDRRASARAWGAIALKGEHTGNFDAAFALHEAGDAAAASLAYEMKASMGYGAVASANAGWLADQLSQQHKPAQAARAVRLLKAAAAEGRDVLGGADAMVFLGDLYRRKAREDSAAAEGWNDRACFWYLRATGSDALVLSASSSGDEEEEGAGHDEEAPGAVTGQPWQSPRALHALGMMQLDGLCGTGGLPAVEAVEKAKRQLKRAAEAETLPGMAAALWGYYYAASGYGVLLQGVASLQELRAALMGGAGEEAEEAEEAEAEEATAEGDNEKERV